MQNVNTDLFFEDSEAGICNLFLKNNQTHDGNVSKILKTQPCLFWLLSFFHYFVVNGLGFIFIFFSENTFSTVRIEHLWEKRP